MRCHIISSWRYKSEAAVQRICTFNLFKISAVCLLVCKLDEHEGKAKLKTKVCQLCRSPQRFYCRSMNRNGGHNAVSLTAHRCLCDLLMFRLWLQVWAQHTLDFITLCSWPKAPELCKQNNAIVGCHGGSLDFTVTLLFFCALKK